MYTKFVNVFKKVRLVCHFLPLLVTLMFITAFTVDLPPFIENYMMLPLTFIGWAAALIARPVQIFTTVFKLVAGGVALGFNIIPIIPVCFILAALGLAVGIWLSLVLLIFAPAAITITCYIKEKLALRACSSASVLEEAV